MVVAQRRVLIYGGIFIIISSALYLYNSFHDSRPLRALVDRISPATCPPAPIRYRPAEVNLSSILKADPLEKHTWRDDGLLEVNPKARHPILDLVERSKRNWEAKLERQSRTLKEAVREYKNRYGRAPPKGFDIWWKFVQSNNIQLPDEYDMIYRDIEPLWAIEPVALQTLHKEAEESALKQQQYCVIVNTKGQLELKFSKDHPRMHGMADFVRGLLRYLPDFRLIIDIYDEPRNFISYEHRVLLNDAAKHGRYAHFASSPSDVKGWAAACPPTSPLRSKNKVASTNKTFIHDHKASMNPCNHPSHVAQNGFLTSSEELHQNGPLLPDSKLLPTFSISRTSLNSDILTLSVEHVLDDFREGIPWDDKFDERLLWRGSTTGTSFTDGVPWYQSQRPRLMAKTLERRGTVDVLLPIHDDAAVGEPQPLGAGKLNSALMDIHFAGQPMQCSDDEYCRKIWNEFDFRRLMGDNDMWNYKYLIDIDGNGWSSRFKRLLTSNSLIFKVTIYPEWFTERIMPWYHYIPIQYDLSDLYDSYMFFHGDMKEDYGHDHLARQIASQGQHWAKTFYRRVDVEAYMIRLLLEYSRVMSMDREAMTMSIDSYDL